MVFFHHGSEWTYVYVPARACDARRRRHLPRRPGLSIPAHHGVPSHPPFGRAGVRYSPRLVHRQSRRGGRPGSQRLASLRRPAGALSRAAVVRERWVFVAGIACCAPFLLSAQAHQQVDIVIAALLVAGCLELTRGRDFAGALLIGLCAAVKGPPLLFIGYLAFRRRWAAAALTFVVAIVVNLLPDLFLFPQQGQLRLAAWIQGSFMPTLSGPIGAWLGSTVYNQSLAGTAQRVNSTWPHAAARGFDFVPAVGRVPDTWLKAAVYAVLIALTAASVVAALRARPRSASPPAEYVQPSRTALEMAAMAMLVQLASPMSDLAHMGPVILAGLCLARLAFLPGEWRSRASLAVALLVGVTVNKDLVGGWVYDLAVWSGAGAVKGANSLGDAARQNDGLPSPSSRGALATKQSTGRSLTAPGFLRCARKDDGDGSVISPRRLCPLAI